MRFLLWSRFLYCRLMAKRQCSYSSSAVGESSSHQSAESPTTAMSLEERRVLILSRPVMVERSISLSDFDDMSFEEHTIRDLMEFQGWVPHLR